MQAVCINFGFVVKDFILKACWQRLLVIRNNTYILKYRHLPNLEIVANAQRALCQSIITAVSPYTSNKQLAWFLLKHQQKIEAIIIHKPAYINKLNNLLEEANKITQNL